MIFVHNKNTDFVFNCMVLFVCLPMAELVYLALFTVLSGAPNTQSARQTPKYCFLLVGHVCCIRNIPQYRLTLAEYRQPKLPSSYQLHHLYSIPLIFRYTLRPAVLLPLLPAGRTLGRPITTLGMSCLQSRFPSSSVVGGSERIISYCAEEHGGRGVYLNKSGIEYNTQTPFPSREKSAVLGIRTGDLADRSQAL
jgi:hypothetical protein